ncbi:MAG TPA: extradiol ring-cleavage dioxygenase [bacterium]|nr:extradiol ring-cleavage dioxygenase [bacterium]
MPLVYACIAPHGEPIIPPLARGRERRRYRNTTRAMQQLAREMRALRPETIVVATPHNLRLRGYVGVVTAEYVSGVLPMFAPDPRLPRQPIRASTDRAFADALLAAARRRDLPAVGANYATASGRYSTMPLDWGTLVPLWFFLRGHRVRPQVVVVTPSREIPLRANVRFGAVIADVARRSRRRVVFVASADHAHAHKRSGPYGYDPAAAQYDALMVEAVEQDDLRSVLRIRPALVEKAKPDSLWQLAMLAGVGERVRLRPELLSYEVPAYYGMICAAYRAGFSAGSRSGPA